MHSKAFLEKTTWLITAIAGLLLAALVYATVDRTKYTLETLVVVPDTVESATWLKTENTLIPEVPDDALYQDFSTNNSAYIDAEALITVTTPAVILPPDNSGSESNPPVDSGEVGGGEVAEEDATSAAPGEAEALPTEDEAPADEAVVPAPEPEPEPVAPEPEPEAAAEETVSAVWGLFPLAQEVITESVEPEPAVVTEVEPAPEPEPEPVVTGEEVVTEESVESLTEEVGADLPTEAEESAPLEEDGATEVDTGSTTDTESTEVIATEEDEVLEPEEPVYNIMDDCALDELCKLYSTTFTGFTIPEFESGTFLAGAELRLSMGAKTKSGAEDELNRFVVEYTYAVGEPWRVATVVDIEDEASNSINGGYYLVALEKPAHQSQLANLAVRLSYQGNIENLERAYVEGVWLEVTSAEFYEESDPDYLSTAIPYDRDLLAPKFHDLTETDLDPALSELPSFTLSYDPQRGFLSRAFSAIFSENQYAVDSVRVIDRLGAVVEVPVKVVYHEDLTWTVQFLEQPQKLVPGKYTVELIVNENETQFVDSFEFYWGVLAVNTTKTMYNPGEEVTFNLAALTEEGDTICDARLLLKVVDPDYVINEVEVNQSGECGKNNVTDVPDYLASFAATTKTGLYTIQLQHLNRDGEVVHKIEDAFEVRDFVDFDIERTAPTRIYPPAPYRVGLKVTANRDFTGDITERVPRGFVLTEVALDAELLTLPTHTELIWRNVTMSEGEVLELAYTFDAPDISPYMYLLGPLSMDGFHELRQWQIASDALTAIASFTGTRTIAGTNLNQTASPFQWATSTLDTFYFDHSTSTDSHEVTLRQTGDYYVAVTLPQQRTDGNNSRTRVGVKLMLNGTVVPQSLGRSGYIRNQNAHSESSSHAHFLLNGVTANDVIEVQVEGLTTIDAGDIVNVTGQASMLLEYIGAGAGVFSATSTQTTNSANLNQTTEYALTWTETRQDSGFVHSDAINPEQIVISNPGTYYVSINVPMTTDSAQTNILGRVRLDGVLVAGGHFKQGYSQSNANEGDGDSSMHWSGIVVATTTNQVVTITTLREAGTGTVNVTSGFFGSVYIRELPTTEVLALRGTAVVGGTNWNPAAAAAIQWSTGVVKDATVFTHSTSTNSHQITIAADGDYFVSYNDALTGSVIRANSRVAILKNGTAISGAQTKTHYTRNQSAHIETSGALAILVEGLVIGDVITVTTVAEAAAGTLDDSTDGILFMWKKAEIDFRPDAPIMYNAPFDNIRFASTTPYFDFSASDPDGTSNIEYEFSISTSTGFVASTTFNSATDSEFFNTASSTDTSPFVEGNKIRLLLTSGDALTDLNTYYWRVRARDITGSAEYGDWSTTQSLTVDMAAVAPSWFQSYSGQFEGDSLVGTVSSGADRVQVDASVSSEVLIAYGEGTVTTPRFRLWDGNSWGVEGSAVAVTNTINWIRTDAAVSRDEYAMVTLDASNDAYAQIYSASSSSWGNRTLLSPVVTSAAYRGVAVAYESLSGDAIAVSCTNSPSPVFRIWNGSAWSATSTISVSSPNNCNFLELASDPASDEMILVVRDTGTQYEALVWDGTAWTDSRVIGSSAKVAREGMSVVYESSGDQAIIAVSNNTNNNIIYTTWNGVEFSTNATQALGNDFEFGRLTADANSDAVALCYIDEDNDIGVLRWDGGVWSAFSELDALGNADTGRPIECRYETLSGRSDLLMASYSDDTAVRYRTATTTAFATEASVGTIQDSYWVQTARAGDGVILAVTLDDGADDLFASSWNGSTWAAETTLETSPSSVIAAPYEMYDMSAKRFLFSEGTVQTPPIDFTAVPGQPTWGDITFDTTEPFGTDVQVRVRYSSSTVCDAYIPDIALPGNSGGFDVTDAPIDLTSLATSTYDQICLEANLTTLGSESAMLDEWTLSWVRQPKLIQSNYRWYVNGSFLTPTDAWPLGATDIAENAAINSDMAVSVNETLRLRLALAGDNVALPAFSETFKLQYAEGLTCSNSLDWHDVGAPASTTALWRGYANSIVGSDWYSASWTKRLKITVEADVVEEGVTDFPVFVNLSDLPAAFFDGVQADGDDIRLTESDGVTEVPFELVSINTTTEIGELHFKADLASTTDTEFFLYYGNGSASGYSVSATYGRNNVWTNNFRSVYHFDQNPAGGAPQFVDSTGNSNGSAVNLESGDLAAGRVGNAISFDGVNEYITTTVNTSLSTSTWSIWLNPSAMPQGAYDGVMFSRGTNVSGISFNSTGARLGYNWNDVAATYNWNGAPTVGAGQWSMAALIIGQAQATEFLFTATGTASGTNSTANTASTINALYFGADTCCGGRYFSGALDEARLVAAARTQGWLQTEYNNHSNPTGFYDVSSEEKVNDGRLLASTLLTNSDVAETYEEENPTRDNQNLLPIGDEAEWDFVLQNNAAAANTNYCFRMVYEDGAVFTDYTNYPRVITNAEPLAPEQYAPFDNQRLASTTPWFEFAATDELGDLVAYEIEVDTDANFGSPDISTDSVAEFALFTNLLQPSQKSEFTSGQRVRFEAVSALSNNTTYWWRVRAIDPSGSAGYGDWSTAHSVTITSGTAITTWYQTTGEQFSTDNLLDAVSSTSTNDIGIDVSFTSATVTSSAIDYDNLTNGNAWGDLTFTHNITSGTIRYRIEYLVSGSTYALVPDVDLTGNVAGFTTSPVSLTGLDTTVYNEIRVVAVLSGNSTLPRLLDWMVTWAETIEIPTHVQPFDNAKVSTTTPAFTFVTTDPESDSIQYELQLSASSDFASLSSFTSGVDAGFLNTISGGDTSPFNSGQTISYTAQSALTNGNTYWWRTRARDPGGDNIWSDFSEPYSFTVDTAITVSAWHQTTGEQFDTDVLSSIETTSGTAEITSTLNEVMMAYGEGTGQAPRYRLWDGSVWSAAGTAESIGAQIRWTDLEAAPTRPEYALGTIGTDADVNVQIYDADNDSWDDVQELVTGITDTLQRGFDIAYETDSGDLLAVSCSGVDAVYSVWNGASWSATSSLNLANANNCLTVSLAADPTTDEIVAAFKHTNTGASDYQLLVWNGSSFGNSLVIANQSENGNLGVALEYEESGNQALVALTNDLATTLLYALWNGSAWSTSTQALGDHMEWAGLHRDVGTDRIALCYVDNDTDAGVLLWNGSAFNTFTEIETTARTKAGQVIDCVYETNGSRDGYLMIPYSDGTNARYQVYATSSFSGELTLDTTTDSWRALAVRGGDGLVHVVNFDDTNDRYDYNNWNGTTWSARQAISSTPSITGTPFDGSLAMVARTYPNFTSGEVRSTTIDFAEGSGPRWERVTFSETTPGISTIEYRIYYLDSNSAYTLVPDSALPGNAAGFTTSPIDISDLDRTVYTELKLDAQLICLSGDCPVLNDWTVEWSEGITVSGTAYEYNASTTLTSGTVSVAVNGVLQSGKTGTINGSGVWTINNVTAFEDDIITVFIDGAADVDEAVGVTQYDGIGDITAMQLARRNITLGSADNPTLSNIEVGTFNVADDEDIFMALNGSNQLAHCADVACGDAKFRVLSGTSYVPITNSTLINFENYGTFAPATTTTKIASGWTQNGTFTIGESTVIFNATSSAVTLLTSTSTHSFYHLTFGETSGTATWTVDKPLSVAGNLNVTYGTVARGTSTIAVAQNLQFATGGAMTGLATTTFSGTGSYTWGDSKSTASSSNLGYVVVDGTAKTVTLAGNVGAQSVTIGADDTLNASGSGYNINVYSSWVNNNAFIPQTGTVTFVGTSTGSITRGASAFNNLSFSGAGSNWSFANPTLALTGNLSIATGTVTLPTGTTTIAGSFTNTGNFLHNNGEVRMTSSVAGRTITQSGTALLNNFYDLVFAGTGAWSFSEANATTTRHFRVQSGTVTFPSTNLTVGGNFLMTGSGVFVHNSGTVTFLVEGNYETRANGSSFNNVRTAAATGFVRTLADTNATILGNLTLATGGDMILPTGILSIGGSLDNNAAFNANGGTVRFNSASGNETVDAGVSSFATLEFNSLLGDFTVTEHATATVAINLTAIQQLTVASGRSLTSFGIFNNAVNTNNTTWTGSTLRLVGNNDITLNAKAHQGEQYGTLEAASSTLVRMWNSSATTYVTTGTTSAIYSQDHAAVNGDLNIYGNYTRTSGTEYWSHAVDFDGASLTGSERQVDVKVASSSLISIQNSSLTIMGTSTGTTTIASISNAFNLTTSNATLNAQYFSFADTGTAGLNLTASTTFATFSDAMFTVTPGRSGISVDATTINANPAEQLFRINFATTTAGAGTNVSVSTGTPTSFIWFRDGVGNLYGELFDANDADPGAVRFDDSSYVITVAGTVYADDGITTLGAPACDGSTPNVRLVVDTGSYTASTSCSATTGAYSFSNVAYVGDPKVLVYLNTNGGVKGSAITKTPTTDITNMHIYANRVIVRHEDASPLTIADMSMYDSADDTDISFTATDAGSDTLVTAANTELYVFSGKTFLPSGNITLTGNGNANSYEGTLALGAGAVFTASGTETHTLAGRLVVGSAATFSAASSTVLFNATTTGKSVTSTSTITFHNVEFAGAGGGWNLGANIIVNGDMDVTTGTVTGTGNINVNLGSLSGNGVLSLGSGTTTIARTNTLGGTSAWTFNNLILGSGVVVGTTTPASTATTTVLGRLTISTAHYLDANNSAFDLAGTGTVLVENGTFLEDTSTVRFSGAGAVVPSTSYYNLEVNAGAGSATYTTGVAGILVYNNLTVGGTASTTFNVTANDPVLEVRGDVLVATNGTLSASNSATLTVLGDYTNNGLFSANGGVVRFTGAGASTIAAGNSSFATLEIDGAGSFTVTANATATAAFSLINHGAFTQAIGSTLAIGGTFLNNLAGGLTTWTGSTLFLYGTSTYEINDSATNDSYETLAVGANTHVRMWNSAATTYTINSLGSLYSQDHAGVNGELYIYGALVRTTGDDFWSYATDFDGTDLSGGSERVAEVYLASGASATYVGNATLQVIGTSAATTTLANQGSGTYGLTIGGTAETEWRYAEVRDINASGVVLTSAPVVTDFSYTDLLVESNSGSAMTVGGTVINANEAKNFTNNLFAFAGGVTGAKNVTATGTSVSSWRFTNHTGNLAGEASDDDPAGDPGYIVWDDSAALITVAGNVYSDEGVTVSTVCDGATSNIRLVVAGLTTYNATCNAGTGAYSITNVAFSPLDTLTLYINDEAEQAANVTVAPISSMGNMHLYENRVIVRHENTNPLTIADMAVWDSSDDADIPFTAVNAGTDTLTLPANRKLIVWTGKTFEPNGNVTLSGAGAGAAYDGTLEAQTNARFRAKATESHSVGGSVVFGTGAEFVSGSSTLALTTTGATRTFDVNSNSIHNLTVSGSGSYVSSDVTMTINGSYAQSAGAFTFGTGTTTIGSAFNVTAGSFTNNGSPFVFTGSGAGNTVHFNNSVVAGLSFTGSGSWNMTDTNATSTGSVIITAGGVTLPSGNFAVGGSFEKRAGTLTHNTAELIMTSATTATVTASSSDLFAIRFIGGGSYSLTDTNITFLDSFTLTSGSVALASGTTAVGGSFDTVGGSFAAASGTVLLNATTGGKVVNPGTSAFYNLQFGAPAGGYTLHSATTTNNLTISSVNNLTLNSGAAVTVNGVFLNSVGGANTTWTNSTLRLNSASAYSVNARANAGDAYATLVIGAGADVKMWYSSAATTTVDGTSSLYSQDHANTNGLLNIYGDLTIASSTEYWSYATDFDGTSLTGSERAVTVRMAANATTTLTTGTLNIIGSSTLETLIENQTTGTYSLSVTGGTINANYYEFSDLDIFGLQITNTPTITNLANGYFDLAVDTGSLITISSTSLNANPSKIFDNVGFDATAISGYNVNLMGETANAWRFTNSYGSIDGEGFDIDGIDACGSVRFDNSSCLLVEQTHFRWRADNGGEGAPNSEWFNLSWDYRTKVRVLNNDNQAYASTAVKVILPYDSAMKSDFTDLRFTDDDGVTPLPFFIEKHTASTEAQVWVRLPDLPASDYAVVYAYYGNSGASASSSAATFDALDSYEDNSLSEYSGDTSLFTTVTSPVYGGTYALAPSNPSGKTTDGIFRFDQTIAQGKMIRYMQYVNTAGGSGDEPCTLFAVQSPGTSNQNYGVCLEQFGTDRISLSRDVDNNDTSGVVLATSTVTYSTGWYEVEIDWRTNNSISVSLYNSAGTRVASTTATDSTYTSGGYGYAFWFQNGAWDSFTARNRVATKPTVYLGARQGNGGAAWISALDGAGSSIPNNTVRLRVSVENSGLDVTGHQYRLEYAAKGVAPTCESVSTGDFAAVPNQASCGSSPMCMQTSTNVTDGDNTTDHLIGVDGTFTPGEVVESPSNEGVALDIDQYQYTELEYVLAPTSNAADNYCFRVTNAGTELDFYAEVAELGLQFDPTFGAVSLNAGAAINLTSGTTTPITVEGTVTDFNGVGDIAHATATIYRSGAGASCTPDNNSCYVASTDNGRCTLTGCTATSCTLSCVVDIFFHADPTDDGTYIGQEWLAYAEAEDYSSGYDFASAPGVEMISLRAMAVDSLINYGSLEADSDTGSFNPTTTVTNLGNTPINVDVEGTNLTDGGSSAIPANLQKVATSTFTYSACVSCQQLSTTTAITLGLNLSKPAVTTPPVETEVYWGIAVPFTASNQAHSGTNIFTAIGID